MFDVSVSNVSWLLLGDGFVNASDEEFAWISVDNCLAVSIFLAILLHLHGYLPGYVNIYPPKMPYFKLVFFFIFFFVCWVAYMGKKKNITQSLYELLDMK